MEDDLAMQQVREGKLESGKDQAIPVYLGLATDKGYPHKGTIDFVEQSSSKWQ